MDPVAAPTMVDLLDLAIKLGLGIIGLYLANSFSRQNRVRVAERRLGAYAALWETMEVATPVRLARWTARPLTRAEREALFLACTHWYYDRGNGMLLAGGTRSLYLRVKDNLVCPLEHYEPAVMRQKLAALPADAQACARGYLSIQQLSLLRTRMKADLAVYGPPYHRTLTADDKALLRFCGENLYARPWSVSPTEALQPEATDRSEGTVDPFVDCLPAGGADRIGDEAG